MATTTTTAPAEIPGLAAADKNFMGSWYQAVKDHPAASRKYTEWGTALAKIPTYDEKLAYIRAIINNTDSKYKDKIPPLAVNWLVESNPGIVDSKGDAFSTDFYKGIISGDAKTRTANSTALKTAKTKVATESAKLANPKATPAELATIVADIVNGSSTKPYNPATLTTAVSSTPSASLYKAGSMSADKLKSTYGNILDPDTGKALFSDEYLKKIASATTASGVQGFNDTLSKVASKVLASQTGSNYLVQSDADKADALTNLLKNPDTLASGTNSLYKKATESKTGINGLLPVGSFKDANGNFVYNGGEIPSKDMSEFVQTYNNQGVANRGAYVAPTYNTDTKMYESKSTSPYANALTSLLGSTKNPFASDYKSSLAQPAAMTSTQLASLNKPFKETTTARDIINLQNSAGMRTGNELTKGSSLSKNLLDLYQTNPDGSAINSPWVADTEDMVIPTTTKPEIDTSTELVQLDPGGLLEGSTVVDPNLAINQDTAEGLSDYEKAGFKSAADYAKALSLGVDNGAAYYKYMDPANSNLPFYEKAGFKTQEDYYRASQLGITNGDKYYRNYTSVAGTPGIDSLPSGTVAGNAGIDTLVEKDTGQPKNSYYDPVNNPNGELILLAGIQDPVPRYGVGPDGTQHDYAKEGASLWNNQLVTPTELETINNYYSSNQLVQNDNGKRVSAFDQAKEALQNSQFVTPTTVTPPVVTNTSGVNPGTPAEQAAEELRKKDLQQKMSQFSLTNAPLIDQPINAGIVTPNINNVVSKENLNTDVKGTNGESSIVDLLKTPTSQPIVTAPPTGPYYNEQDQARSQAAQQGVPITGVSSLPSNSGITSLVGPQQLTPQQLAQQQLLQSTGIGRS